MAPRRGAFSQRQARLREEYPSWTEQERAAAEELSRLGLKTLSKLYTAADGDEEQLDESGFYPEETALDYVAASEAGREDGELHEVYYRRIAIRKAPSTEARVLGAACAGEHLVLFDWDATRTWRSMHYRLRGGYGGLVQAWVMMRHPQLGTLVRAPGAPIEVGSTPTCLNCGHVLSPEAAFCSKCGTRRPGPVVQESDDVTPAPLHYTGLPEQPRGFRAPVPQTAVAEGNLRVLLAAEVGEHAAQGASGEAQVGGDGCVPASGKELAEMSTIGCDCYEVCHRPFIAIRSSPSTDGRIVGTCTFGQRVDTFGWDESGTWRRVFGTIAGREESVVSAWILVHRDGIGPLLRMV